VLLTYSRSSWVAIFVAALLVMIYQKKYSFLFYSVIVTGLVFLGSDSVRNVVFSVAERVADIFAGTSDDSSRFRLILLETAILMWLDSYTFGVGYQGFSTMFQNYYPPQEVGGVFEPHNEYYTVLAELGLIGFVVFMFLLWKIVKTGWNSLKAYNAKGYSTSIPLGLFASFIAYLVFFQFLGGMQLHSILTINIGLLFCASKFVNTEEDSDSALQTEPVA
jgi:O-antigen ligase